MTELPVLEAAVTQRRLISDHSSQQLAQWCEQQGERPFRAEQIRRWIYGKRVNSFAEMHDVPAKLREALAAEFDFFASTVVRHQKSKDGTEKLLLAMRDGENVEC